MPETQARKTGVSILDRIVETKVLEVRKLSQREAEFVERLPESPAVRDFAGAIMRTEVALIAEIKRRSPGAGDIRPEVVPGELARLYERSGASAVSVLTDGEYFGGSMADLSEVRDAVETPILRKDFIIDERQVVEARVAGADAVLLIVRILEAERLAQLLAFVIELGMEALVEAHDTEEVEVALDAGARILGVNNRDLSTFETDLGLTARVARTVPREVILVSESGIRSGEDVAGLGEVGVDAILVGESLLRRPDPAEGVVSLVGHEKRLRG